MTTIDLQNDMFDHDDAQPGSTRKAAPPSRGGSSPRGVAKAAILKSWLAALAFVVVGVGAVRTSDAAEANRAGPKTFHSRAFNMSKTVVAKDSVCVTYTLWGKLTWERVTRAVSSPKAGGGTHVYVLNRKVENPTISVKTWTGPKCRTKRANRPVFGATLSQTWYEKSCSAGGLDISASVPWGVSVGTTLTCGNGVRKARLSQSFGAKSSTYRLNNSGRPPSLPGSVAVGGAVAGAKVKTRPACVAVDVSAKIKYKRNAADVVHTTFNVCTK